MQILITGDLVFHTAKDQNDLPVMVLKLIRSNGLLPWLVEKIVSNEGQGFYIHIGDSSFMSVETNQKTLFLDIH